MEQQRCPSYSSPPPGRSFPSRPGLVNLGASGKMSEVKCSTAPKSFFDMRIRETDGVEFGVDVEDNDPTLSNIKQHHTTSRVSR